MDTEAAMDAYRDPEKIIARINLYQTVTTDNSDNHAKMSEVLITNVQ
jgi:hypothetical protein